VIARFVDIGRIIVHRYLNLLSLVGGKWKGFQCTKINKNVKSYFQFISWCRE